MTNSASPASSPPTAYGSSSSKSAVYHPCCSSSPFSTDSNYSPTGPDSNASSVYTTYAPPPISQFRFYQFSAKPQSCKLLSKSRMAVAKPCLVLLNISYYTFKIFPDMTRIFYCIIKTIHGTIRIMQVITKILHGIIVILVVIDEISSAKIKT